MTTAHITITHNGRPRTVVGEHLVQVKHYVREDERIPQDMLDARTVTFVQKLTAIGVLPNHDVSIMPTLQYVDEDRPRVEVEVTEDAQ